MPESAEVKLITEYLKLNLENKIMTTVIDHRWIGQDLRMRFKLK